MRFAPVFLHLPSSVPGGLYNTEADQTSKPKKKPDAAPSEAQVDLVRAAARQLDPELLLLLPKLLGESDLHTLTEEASSLLGSFCTDFFCDGERLYDCVTGDVVAEGDVAKLYNFCNTDMKNAIPAVREAYVAGRFQYGPKDLKHRWSDLLDEYRKDRAFSRGLDRLSKFEQLDMIDQSHVVNKFANILDEPVVKALHIGSGDLCSSSMLAIDADDVVCLDPRLPEGSQHFVKGRWQDHNFSGYDAIISDVATPGALGMSVKDQDELLQELAKASEKASVVVKVGIAEVQPVPGLVVRKPRPHNLETIAILEPGLPDLNIDLKAEGDKIIAANEARNAAVFGMRFPENIKELYNTGEDIVKYIKRKLPPCPPLGRVRSRISYDRNEKLISKSRSNRLQRWLIRCRDPTVPDPHGSFAMRSSSFHIIPGPAARLDPGIGDVECSMSSLWHIARHRGMRMHYIGGEWHVKYRHQ